MVAKKDRLTTYRERRDVQKSPEPAGDVKKKSKKGKKLSGAQGRTSFVIQKHDASHLHYDFRLDIDGVLVSWAVPKGPSTDPRDKRLAIQTEDHPMAYAAFEGVIPEGNYGAGTVMVWDSGTYENIKYKDGALVSMAECLKNGQIEVVLHGVKLLGAYALIKTRWNEGAKSQWLLMKMKDEFADASRNLVVSEPDSVLTGRTMAQIARGELAEIKKETGELQKKLARKKRVPASKKTQGE
ncbi:MAG: DNA polymerase ligase N-terminal domain-containing protein [Hydrogenophaga sp.]|nr:DNA polymerase ligase N-terminal domain-containing protein [Hydrogenophaga sp.]